MATSVVATATSTSGTITVPSSGAAAGDIAILCDSSRDSGSGSTIPTKVIPSGWTELTTGSGTANGGNGFRTTLSYKVLTGGDLGASITGQNSNVNSKQMLVLRTDAPVSGATAGTLNYQVTTGDPTLQTVTPPTTAYPVLVVGGFHVNAAGTFTVSPSGTALSASAAGITWAALEWIKFGRPSLMGAVTGVIAGPRTEEQWDSYVAALDTPFTAEDEAFIDSLVAQDVGEERYRWASWAGIVMWWVLAVGAVAGGVALRRRTVPVTWPLFLHTMAGGQSKSLLQSLRQTLTPTSPQELP